MRHALPVLALGLLAHTGCSSSVDRTTSPATTSAALSASSQGGDSADTSCQVVLRHTLINFESRLGPQTDCSSGTCWVMVWVTFDVAMSQSLAQSEAFVLWKGETSPGWQQSAPAEPIFSAPEGYRRYQVLLASNTFTAGNGATDVSLIPFLQTFGQSYGRVFDHNRVADPLGSYLLTASDNWTIADDNAACPGATPTSTLALTFGTGWTNTATGALAAGGKLDVAYDVYRMPQVLGCTTDGVDAFAISGYVQFHPGEEVQSEVVSGPFDSTTGKYDSLPLEFDVPGGTTSASLWFEGGSDCNGGPVWDSNFGQNYDY